MCPRWPSGLERWLALAAGQVRIPLRTTSLRNFGNSVYPALPVSFGGDTKSRRPLLSGVYASGSKISHQSARECVTVVDSTTCSKLPDLQSAIIRRKTLPCTCIGRRRSYVYSKQLIFGLTQEWLSFSRLECGVPDRLHISSADWWDLLLPLA